MMVNSRNSNLEYINYQLRKPIIAATIFFSNKKLQQLFKQVFLLLTTKLDREQKCTKHNKKRTGKKMNRKGKIRVSTNTAHNLLK